MIDLIFELKDKHDGLIEKLPVGRAIGAAALAGALALSPASSVSAKEPTSINRQDVLDIDMEKIKQIESSGNAEAVNNNSGARGLYQITPIVLKEWNQDHKNEQYTEEDLFNAAVNTKIAKWYIKKITEHYLPHYKIPVTIDNVLIAYNWGIGNLRKYVKGDAELPQETVDYVAKYKGEI